MASIYIHIPFCRHICHYCDFHHSASLLNVEAMVDAICMELDSRADFLGGQAVQTLYFGGGTPSVCSAEQLGRIMDRAAAISDRKLWSEVTLEANPEDLSPEYLGELRALGFNRLSIGIQSFHDDHLRLMNRHHMGVQAEQAVRDVQQAGFDNITIDLMYGLPFMSVEQWGQNLERAIALGVQHISAYHLGIEPHTVFGKRGLAPISEQDSAQHYGMLCSALQIAGFEHYEISNFALPGHHSRHNSSYWSGDSYLGVGPAAHSYDGSCRVWNVSSNRQYLAGAAPQVEVLTPVDVFNETVMTALRTAHGLEVSRISSLELVGLLRCAKPHIAAGRLFYDGTRLSVPESEFLISDSIIADLFQV